MGQRESTDIEPGADETTIRLTRLESECAQMTFKYKREADMGRKLRAIINDYRLARHEKDQCIQRLTNGLQAADIRSTKLMQEIEEMHVRMNHILAENEHYAQENVAYMEQHQSWQAEKERLNKEIVFTKDIIAKKDALLMSQSQ